MNRMLSLAMTAGVFCIGYLLCVYQFPSFLSLRVLANLFNDNAFLGITAVGMTFVIVAGGIDLSVGSVIAFTTVFVAVAIGQWGWPPFVAFAAILAICALFGAAMGWLIHRVEIPAFIVTLAGLFLARGAAFLISTESVPIDAPFYADLASYAAILPGGARLSLSAMIMIAAFVLAGIVLHRTRFGANVYALGGDRQSAALMGVPIGRTTMAIYTISSLLAGLAGIVFSFYTSAGYSLSAVGTELDTIAAVVIGGTLLSGGYGLMAGTLLGVLIQGLIQTYIVFDGTLSSWWAKIVIGGLLFAFIAVQQILVSVAAYRRLRRPTAALQERHP
jgi:simple sugar transport system permease protein